VLAGKYALGAVLGAGSMGSVYQAENLLVGRKVAVKVLSSALAARPEVKTAFLGEARIAARIGHENVVDILDVGVDAGGQPFIVMELLDGETLEEILSRRGPLPVPYACELMLQVLAAVGAAHRAGIIHRDLKPANIVVTHPEPDRPRVKVLDFGISEGLCEGDHAGLGSAGTPLYMPPEQALGMELGPSADVYSSAAILYELLSGEAAFGYKNETQILKASLRADFEPLSARTSSVPESLSAAISRGLSPRSEDRPESAAAFAELILPWADPSRVVRMRPSLGRSLDPFPLVADKPRITFIHPIPKAPKAPELAALEGPSAMEPSPPRPTPEEEENPMPPRSEPELTLAAIPGFTSENRLWTSGFIALASGFSVGIAVCYWLGFV